MNKRLISFTAALLLTAACGACAFASDTYTYPDGDMDVIYIGTATATDSSGEIINAQFAAAVRLDERICLYVEDAVKAEGAEKYEFVTGMGSYAIRQDGNGYYIESDAEDPAFLTPAVPEDGMAAIVYYGEEVKPQVRNNIEISGVTKTEDGTYVFNVSNTPEFILTPAVMFDSQMRCVGILSDTSSGATFWTKNDCAGVPLMPIVIAVAAVAATAAAVIIAVLKRSSGAANDSNNLTIKCIGGSLDGKEYIFNGTDMLIGRSEKADIAYPPYEKCVSKEHCKLFVFDNRLLIMDMNSSCGTFIQRIGENGNAAEPEKILPHVPVPLETRYRFYVGDMSNMFIISE